MTGTASVAFSAGLSVVVENAFGGGDESRLIRIRPGGRAEPIDTGRAPQIDLHDVAVIEGEPRIVFTTYVGDKKTSGTETWGYLYIQDPDSAHRQRVAVAFAPEFGIGRASYGGGVIVASATSDLTESFESLRADGSRVKGRPNPTDDLEYNHPPFMSDAVLSPDGTWLAYLEGPDTSIKSPTKAVGSWVVVVLSQRTGGERLRVMVANRDLCVSWLDFDGRWLVISRTKPLGNEEGVPACYPRRSEPLPVLVLDTQSKPLELVELTDVVGVATIAD